MELQEPDYNKIVHELFKSHSLGEIGDKIDTFYTQSPLKGTTFYFRIIVASHRHSFSQLEPYKNTYNRIKDYCSQKIQAIGNEKSLLFESVQNAQNAVKDLKNHPKLFSQIVDKFAVKYGKTDLELLFSGVANEKDLENNTVIQVHILNLITKLDKEEKDKSEQLRLSIKTAKNLNRAFWWTFGFGIVGGICGAISLVIKLDERYSDQKESRQQNAAQESTLSLSQSQNLDSKQTSTLSTPTPTKK